MKNWKIRTKKADTAGDMTLSPFTALLACISEIEHVLADVADGDPTSKLPLLSEQDSMGRSLTDMLQNLQDMLAEINISSSKANTGANQLAHGAQALAEESAAASQEMPGQSAMLAELISQYNLDDDPVAARIIEHSHKRLLPGHAPTGW